MLFDVGLRRSIEDVRRLIKRILVVNLVHLVLKLVVPCADQAEVDYYWTELLAGGGREVACGWLTDKYGLSWQIVPTALFDMIRDQDQAKAARATQAMLGMVKLDIAALRAAADGADERPGG